jgi:putative endonuclease
MYHVYVLLSLKDSKFYIGFSTDVDAREKKHNRGEVTSTRNRRPFKLLYFESYINKFDALRRERYFKTTPGRKTLKLMLRETLKQFK